MSRVFEALQQANLEMGVPISDPAESPEGMSQFAVTFGADFSLLDEASRFVIPDFAAARLAAWNDPNSMAAERFRALAARLRHAQQRRTVKKILVTSAVRGDGKSTVSVNLAITLAAQGEKTLLIDGDLHQPALGRALAVDSERGFADCCETSEPVTNLLQRAESLPLWFFPAGKCESQPLTLLQSPQASELLKQLAGWFSWIVIDSPPLAPLADSSVWARMSDAVLLLARQSATPKKALLKGVETLDKSKIFALLMNDSSADEERYYRDYYKRSGNIAIAHKAGSKA
jgi:capsular exopolysaccharide synthesis family protein